MIRFLLGLALGVDVAVIVWAVCRNTGWALLIGLCVAVLAWVGHRIIPDLIDTIGDFF